MKLKLRHLGVLSAVCAVAWFLPTTTAFAAFDSVIWGTTSGSLDSPTACATVPVELMKGDSPTRVSAYKITIALSDNLELCTPDNPAASIVQGDWAEGESSPIGIKPVDGTYEVGVAVLGGWLATGGTLFNVSVKATVAGASTGYLRLEAVTLQDDQEPPGYHRVTIGPDKDLPINIAPPSDSLVADRQHSGNTPDDGTAIIWVWPPALPAGATAWEVWRASFGNYPSYDGFAKPLTSTFVNFQPSGLPIPAGYTADYGLPFNGVMGWTGDMDHFSMYTRDSTSTDPTDTFVRKRNDGAAAVWSIVVANGSHEVTVTCGDPVTTSTPYVLVEGDTLFDGNTTLTGSHNLIATRTTTVDIADGNLTLQIGGSIPGRSDLSYTDTKLNSIQFTDGTGGGVGVPTPPTSHPPQDPWELVYTGPDPFKDHELYRDEFYYVAFAKYASGDFSAPSNMTGGTLNYHLGDVYIEDVGVGDASRPGDNKVSMADVTYLSLHYGKPVNTEDPLPQRICDIGPTRLLDFESRPQTDGVVDFEDLVVLAHNYRHVGKSQTLPAPALANELSVDSPPQVAVGETFTVSLWLSGAGDLLAASVALQWNPSIVEPAGVEAGELLSDQGGIAFSPSPGVVDMAILGPVDAGLSGRGLVAMLAFRAKGSGDPGIEIASIDARDLQNRRVEVQRGERPTIERAPAITSLMYAAPNPFNPGTTLVFSLAERGPVELTIYSVDGRKVRTLPREVFDSGVHEMQWDGTDDRGIRVASGRYYVRLATGSVERVRPITMVK